MKKFVLLLVIFLAVTGATLFAQDVSSILGAIPSASYAHPSDGTVWVFSATSISIQEGGRTVATIPGSEMKGLALAAQGTSPGFTFSYATEAYDRTYRFNINAISGALTRTIDRAGLPQDVVELRRQR